MSNTPRRSVKGRERPWPKTVIIARVTENDRPTQELAVFLSDAEALESCDDGEAVGVYTLTQTKRVKRTEELV